MRSRFARSRLLVVAVAVLALATGSRAEDDATARAFVERVVSPQTCYVQQVVRLRLRVGIDAAWFRDHVVPAFRREVDMPVHVTAPLGGRLPLRVLPRDDRAPDAKSRLALAVGEAVVAASRGEDVVRDGRAWTVAEFETAVLPEFAGDIVVPAPSLTFVWGTEVTDDIVSGRVATDARTAVVAGAAVTLRVLPLPEDGRPPGFSGAVGRFTVRADAAPREVAAGGSVRVTLSIEGEGNLAEFDTPRLDVLPGFDVLGALDDRGAKLRTITWDVAPRAADVTAVPPIAFVSFDPGPPAAYRIVRTAAIPITVRAGAGPSGRNGDARTNGQSGRGANAAEDAEGSRARSLLVVALVAVAIAAFVLLLRRRGTAHQDPARSRALAAAAAFRVGAEAPGADIADALAEFLAAHLGCPAASVITPDLARRLAEAGVAQDVAVRAAALLERLVAARYGGGAAPAGAAHEAHEIVDALDAALRRREPGR